MPSEETPLTILHADEAIVAIDKPAGLLVHRTRLAAGTEESALSRVRAQLGAFVFPVHRLDRATSGVLVFGRTPTAAQALARAFEDASVAKRYVALVRGWPEQRGVIDHPLARDPERASAGQPLLESRTSWRRLARVEWPFAVDPRHPTSRYALIEVHPRTGRRQQIRRHCHHIAHPLIGDTTHGRGEHNRAVAAWLGVTRLWLHALALTVPHPITGQPLTIQAPLGAEWRTLLTRGEWLWDDDALAPQRPPVA